MNTPYQSRSVEGDFSPATHYHQQPNQRGFRGRRPYYRNRGSYQQHKNTPWKPHVTVKEEPLGDASLLARLEPAPGSLLNRLSPAKDSQSPEMSKGRVPLMNRISGIKQEEREVEIMEIVDVDEVESIASSRRVTPQTMPTEASKGALAEQLIADALTQGQQVAVCTPTRLSRRSPGSEAAVDDILATEDMQLSSSPPMPVHPLARTESNITESVASASSRSTSADRATLIEQAKGLIAPLIARNAKLRNPELDPKVLEEQALRLVTEEQCLQFMKFAAESRKQMKAGNTAVPSMPRETEQESAQKAVHEGTMGVGNGAPAQDGAAGPPTRGEKSDTVTKECMPMHAEPSSGTKRSRSVTADPHEPARPHKTPRRTSQPQSGEAGPSSIRTSAAGSLASSLRRDNPASRLGKAPPTAPRAWRMAEATISALPAVDTSPFPPVEAAKTNNQGQGKLSSPADQSSIGTPPDGRAERERSPAAANGESVRPVHELKETVSFAESEDMDISSSPRSIPAIMSPPVRQNQQPTLTSVETNQTGGNSGFKTSSPQGNTIVEPKQAGESTSSVSPSAERPLHSNTVESGSPAAPNGQPHVSLSLQSNGSKDTTNANPSDGHTPRDSAASDTILPPIEEVSNITSASNVSNPVLPGGLDSPVMPPGGPPDDIPSETQTSPALGTSTARADTNPPKNGDNSFTPTQEISLTQHNDTSDAKCVDNVSLSAATSEPETSGLARRSPFPTPHASTRADKKPSPVPHTDTPPSAFPSSSSAAVQSQTPPAPVVGRPQSTMEEVAAPPPDATSPESRPTSPSRETAAMEVDAEASNPALPVSDSQPANPSPLQLPGLCFAEIGRTHAAVNTVTFEVDDALATAAKRWAERRPEHDPASCVVFELLCLHASDVQAVVQAGESVSPAAFAAALRKLKTRWPPRGQLVVEMNRDTVSRGSWLPKHLGPEDGPLDVTPNIVPGTNTIRLIQLGGQADLLFILYVGRPDENDTSDSWEHWLRTLRQKP